MPKMSEPGQQVKVWLPQPLYDALNQESDDSGRKMAEIMREAIAERYQRQAVEAGLDVVIDAGARTFREVFNEVSG